MTQEKISPLIDPLEITTDQERRKVFLRYANRAWLIFGIVTLASLPIFPEQRDEFIFLIALIFPTYLITRILNLSERTRWAGVVFVLSVNFGFYGLFMLLVGQLGAYKAFETQTTVWMLMGLAVLFAGAFVDKWAAPVLAVLNSILLIGTQLMIAPGSDPRPSALVFWGMMALTSWLYEGTLHGALRRSWAETMERRQAHKAIQEAELKYRMLVERLPVVVYTSELGANGTWHYVSPQIELLLGFTPDEWMADPGLWFRQIHPDDRDRQVELEEQAWVQQESFESEYRILTRDGRLIWVRDSAYILPPQNDGAPIVQGVLMDITERKQAEDALRESESLLQEAQIIANMGSYVLDFASGIWKSSAILDKLFGIDDAYIRSVEGWSNLIHPDHRQQMTDYFTNEVMGKHIRFDREYKIIRKNDGVERWVHGLGELEIDAQDKLLKMHGVIQDITERKQMDESLSASEAELRALFISMQDVVLVIDRDGVYRKIAPTNPALLVSPPDELLGKNLRDVFSVEQAETFISTIQLVLNEQQTSYIEYELAIGNQKVWFATSISPMDPESTLWVARDITGRKHVEDEMHRRVMELETLYESGLAINQLLDPSEIGHKVIELLEQKLDWHHTTIRLYHPQDESFELLAFNQPGLKSEEERREVEERFKVLIADTSQGMSGWAVRHKQLIRSNDLRNDARYVETYPGLQSGLYVPIKLGERVVGVISIESEQPNAFSAADERLTATLANQAASALENARLFEAERKQRQVSDALRDALSAGASMSVSLDFETILDRLLEALERVVPFEGGSIMLVQPEKQKINIARMRGYKKQGRDLIDRISKFSFDIPAVENLRWVLENKQPLVIPDIQQYPSWIRVLESSFIRSWAGAPIIVNDEVIAIFSLDSTEPNFFTNEQVELLRAFTGQASLALQNARLFEETAHRAQEFASLYETSNALSASNELNTLLKNIVEHATTLLNTATGSMYLYDRTNDILEIVVTTTSDLPIGATLRIGEGVAGKIAQTHQPMRIEDYSTWEGRSHKYDGILFRAILEVPMLFGGDLIGVLNVAEMGDSNRLFTESDERLLSLFAAQAAGVLHSARLREETARRFQEFASLYETSKALSAENDLNALLQVIVNHAVSLLGISTGAIYLYNESAQDIVSVVAVSSGIPVGTHLNLGEGVSGRVAQTRLPMRVDDYSNWEGRSPKFEGQIYRAVLNVPMLFGGKLIGVLAMTEMGESKRKFTEADERLLSLFAAQAAGAIHSTRLYEETERRAREFASLYETSNALSAENELNAMLQVIVEHARNLLDSASSGMYLYLPEAEELELTVDTAPYIPFGTRLKLNEGVAGRVAQTRQPLRVDNYLTWEGRSPLFDGTSIRAVLEVPMLYGGELIGVLTADEVGDSERKFTEADERLLSLFASQAAGAIHSARLREQTARRLDQLQALHLIHRAISSSFDLRPILNTVIAQSIAQLNVDAVDVLLFHPHLQMLDYVAGQGFRKHTIEQTQLRLGEGYAGRAAFERRTIHVSNLPETGSSFTPPTILEGESFLEYYAVPLIAKGEIKGVLEIFNRASLPLNPEWLDFLETLAGQAAITIDQTQLFDNLQRANLELIVAYDATIEGWARAMDLRDKETESHTRRVTKMTVSLAKTLGIKDNEIFHIRRGALLHDIGKMGVPDNILLKEGKLTAEEWVLMRQHPQFAHEMLQPIKYLRQSLDIPYCHHEKWDGTGYPRGLKGEQIPFAARIFAVIDVWDAVTIDRPYRKGWTKQKALKYIREQSGKYFEPRVVDAFLEMFGNKKS